MISEDRKDLYALDALVGILFDALDNMGVDRDGWHEDYCEITSRMLHRLNAVEDRPTLESIEDKLRRAIHLYRVITGCDWYEATQAVECSGKDWVQDIVEEYQEAYFRT